MADYKDRLGGLTNKIKTETPSTPIQEIKPVEAKEPKTPEAQLNVWIPRTLLKRLKAHGVETDESLKEITIKALEAYLKL